RAGPQAAGGGRPRRSRGDPGGGQFVPAPDGSKRGGDADGGGGGEGRSGRHGGHPGGPRPLDGRAAGPTARPHVGAGRIQSPGRPKSAVATAGSLPIGSVLGRVEGR